MNRWDRWARALMLLASGSSLLGLGSCLGLDLKKAARFGAAYAASEFLFDSDLVFDLFEDGLTPPGDTGGT